MTPDEELQGLANEVVADYMRRLYALREERDFLDRNGLLSNEMRQQVDEVFAWLESQPEAIAARLAANALGISDA